MDKDRSTETSGAFQDFLEHMISAYKIDENDSKTGYPLIRKNNGDLIF